MVSQRICSYIQLHWFYSQQIGHRSVLHAWLGVLTVSNRGDSRGWGRHSPVDSQQALRSGSPSAAAPAWWCPSDTRSPGEQERGPGFISRHEHRYTWDPVRSSSGVINVGGINVCSFSITTHFPFHLSCAACEFRLLASILNGIKSGKSTKGYITMAIYITLYNYLRAKFNSV